MSKYISCAASLFNDFERYRITSRKWNKRSKQYLQSFDKYCLKEWPDAKELSQDMVNNWCKIRFTEKPNSCSRRVSIVMSCIKYLHERNIHNEIRIPEVPHQNKCLYIPHAFTPEELGEFFKACDNIPLKNNTVASRLRKLQLPVIFRLLLSSGMRTIEARMLRVEDVNLDEGIISIRKSKGPSQHFVALDDYMLEILRRYDKVISGPSLCPDREYFFPSSKGTPYHDHWLSENFKKLWNESQYGKAVPYDLRHYYATFNINSWIGFGLEFNAKFLYLSKSMGHTSVEFTKYYYNLVPALSDVMLELTNDSFNEIIPDVNYEDE